MYELDQETKIETFSVLLKSQIEGLRQTLLDDVQKHMDEIQCFEDVRYKSNITVTIWDIKKVLLKQQNNTNAYNNHFLLFVMHNVGVGGYSSWTTHIQKTC
jgi:hypothetical protein